MYEARIAKGMCAKRSVIYFCDRIDPTECGLELKAGFGNECGPVEH